MAPVSGQVDFPASGGSVHVPQPRCVEGHGCQLSCGHVSRGQVWTHGLGDSEETRDLSGYSSIFPRELPTPDLLVSGQVLAGATGRLGR